MNKTFKTIIRIYLNKILYLPKHLFMSEYIGNELELFKHAKNWKLYYKSKIKNYIKGDVLEVGAGIGETTKSLFNSKCKSWTCIEPDDELTKVIKDKIKTAYLPPTIEAKSTFLSEMNQEKKYDTILYIDVIEHIEKDHEELKLAEKFLNPNGHLIILVPAHQYLFSPFDKAIGHFRRYNKNMLKTATPKNLKQEKLIYLDSLGLLTSLANKWFLKQSYPKIKQILFWDNFIVPASKILDVIICYKAGKSLIGIWKKE